MSDVTLHLGDCLDVLPTLAAGSVDAVVTDPPYGIEHSTGWAKLLYGQVATDWNNGEIAGDNSTDLRDFVLRWAGELPCAVFGTWKQPKPKNTRAVLIWDKGGASGMGDLSMPWKPSWEEIYILGRGWQGFRDTGVLKGHHVPPRISMGRSHPNEKPVSLLMTLIQKLPNAVTIFDPFMGTGATGVAAVRLGRNFIGCEINPAYYQTAQRRIAAAQAQLVLPLFGSEAIP